MALGPDRHDHTRERIGELDWTAVAKRLSGRAFAYQNERDAGAAMVASAWDADPDMGVGEKIDQSLRLGLLAWSIAEALRREYRHAPAARGLADWDFVTWMTDEQERRATRRALDNAAAEEMWKEVPNTLGTTAVKPAVKDL